MSFHPTGELLLAGGFDKTLRLFQVRYLCLSVYASSVGLSVFACRLCLEEICFRRFLGRASLGFRGRLSACLLPPVVGPLHQNFPSEVSEKLFLNFCSFVAAPWLWHLGSCSPPYPILSFPFAPCPPSTDPPALFCFPPCDPVVLRAPRSNQPFGGLWLWFCLPTAKMSRWTACATLRCTASSSRICRSQAPPSRG